MATNKIKLYYFQGRGRAEVLRQILCAAKLPFDNVRFAISEWDGYKKLSPWGTFPLLEYDGFYLGGSMAIARFVAKKGDLVGDSDQHEAMADSIAEQCQEYYDKVMDIHMGVQGDENKKAAAKKIMDKFLPRFLKQAEEILDNNGGEFLVGKRLTYADIIMAEYLAGLIDPHDPYIVHWCPFPEARLQILEPFPLLRAHIDRVQAVPEIKAWLEKRPKGQDEEL